MAKLKTGRHTSALKENRKNIKRREANASKNKAIRTLVKEVETAIANKETDKAKKLLNTAFALFDKAVKTNRIHKKNAARKKGKLAKKVAGIKA